jgi:carbamoyl-phosphate synthase large subunit
MTSKHNLRLLFTSVGRRVELIEAFRRAADTHGFALTIFGADVSTTAPALHFCERQLQTARIEDPDYIPQLLEICQNEEILGLIPTIDTDLLLLAEHKASFEVIGTKVFVSAPALIALCRDKRKTSEFFKQCGLKTPVTVDDIELYQGGFPAFVKPLDGSSSIDAYRVESPKELEFWCGHIEKYIIQPFIKGREYTVDVFADYEGKPIYITPRERLAIRSGEVLKTRICQDERIINEVQALVGQFKPCGALAVQLIRDEGGDDYFTEINPRFGGGAPLSMKAGADAALALLRILAGEELGFVPKAARDGAVYSRFDQSICVEAGV